MVPTKIILNSFATSNISRHLFTVLPFNGSKRPNKVSFFPVASVVPVRNSFFESNPRGTGYPGNSSDLPHIEQLKIGARQLKKEIALWIDEVKTHFRQDRKIFVPGDTDVIFRFDTEECLEKWITTSDKSHNDGNSVCNLIINNNRKAVFYGNVDTVVPKDGKAKRTGYCNIRSQKLRKSFYRDDCYEWDLFTHLELRVRGDGRNYAVHLGMGYTFDVNWLDLYTYSLYTHGGPYWQTVRIPFSKFYLTHKGRIQDKQQPIPLSKVNSVGIMCAGVPGPFRLEIDYIGVHFDDHPGETFAYEMYEVPKYFLSY